jgi:hypothetical protein
MNTALEYSTRVVQEGGRRCKKSTLNDLVHLTPLRIPLMNPPIGTVRPYPLTFAARTYYLTPPSLLLRLQLPQAKPGRGQQSIVYMISGHDAIIYVAKPLERVM